MEPTKEFKVPGATMSVICGLKNGQKFTNDKPMIVDFDEKSVKKTEGKGDADEVNKMTSFAYSVPYPLKFPTAIAM